jgi:hypothetical protein
MSGGITNLGLLVAHRRVDDDVVTLDPVDGGGDAATSQKRSSQTASLL